MLARTYGPRYSAFPCFLQPKLNGIRALAHCVDNAIVMQSRDEKLWTYPFFKELYDQLSVLYREARGHFGNAFQSLLDGELYVHGWRLQDINSAVAVNRKERTEKTPFVQYHIFDTIPNLTSSFTDRWVGFYSLVAKLNLPLVKAVPTHYCDSPEVMQKYFHHYTADGYEGVMLRTDEPYFLGETSHGTEYRSRTLWKYKHWEDAEFPCVGYTQGEGKAAIGIGALILSTDSGRAFKVGTGFTDEERVSYLSNPPLGCMVRVRYLELTADGIPFNPSFLAVLS